MPGFQVEHFRINMPTVFDAYLVPAAAIYIKLARLRQLVDDHFGHDPDAIQ